MMNMRTFYCLFFVTSLVSCTNTTHSIRSASHKDIQIMDRKKYGEPNPNAPKELSQFAFLVGTWRCEVKEKGQDGSWKTSDDT